MIRPGGLSASEELGILWEYLDEAESDFLYDEIVVRKSYTREGICLEDGAVVVDVGANIGLFSLYCAAQWNQLTLVAIEPIPPIVDVLRRNLTSVRRKANVYVVEDAVGGSTDNGIDFNFHYVLDCPGESTRNLLERQEQQQCLHKAAASSTFEEIRSHQLEKSSDSADIVSRTFRCRLRTLESIIRDLGLNKVDLLKVRDNIRLLVVNICNDETYNRLTLKATSWLLWRVLERLGVLYGRWLQASLNG
jgi:FkbM family methyltransferase